MASAPLATSIGAVVWLAALWLGVGYAAILAWVKEEGFAWWQRLRPQAPKLSLERVTLGLAVVTVVGLVGLIGWRWSTQSLRQDRQVDQFVAGVLEVIEPNSIIISSADAETFALWYAAWGSGVLREAAPDVVLINYALYQFGWYQRLVAMQYPEVVGESRTVEEIVVRNAGQRSVFFSEKFSYWPAEQMEPAGSIWRYQP